MIPWRRCFENISKKKRSWNSLYFRESKKSLCVWYLWNLKTCENGEVMSPFTLYGKLKWVGIIPPKSFRKKPIRWICTSPLDVRDSTPPRAFSSALRNSKHQWQVWGVWNIPSHTCELKNRVVLCHENQNPVFSLSPKGKNQSFEGLLWGWRSKIHAYWALGLWEPKSISIEF